MYTISSSNINTTNIFQFLASFAQLLPILPQKMFEWPNTVWAFPDFSYLDTLYHDINTGFCSIGLQRDKVKEILILQKVSYFWWFCTEFHSFTPK